jgi:hypothetical protein
MNTFEPTPKAMTHAHQLPTNAILRKIKQKEEKHIRNTSPYSDSLLSSLSSHKGADWIITRAPEGSLQF